MDATRIGNGMGVKLWFIRKNVPVKQENMRAEVGTGGFPKIIPGFKMQKHLSSEGSFNDFVRELQHIMGTPLAQTMKWKGPHYAVRLFRIDEDEISELFGRECLQDALLEKADSRDRLVVSVYLEEGQAGLHPDRASVEEVMERRGSCDDDFTRLFELRVKHGGQDMLLKNVPGASQLSYVGDTTYFCGVCCLSFGFQKGKAHGVVRHLESQSHKTCLQNGSSHSGGRKRALMYDLFTRKQAKANTPSSTNGPSDENDNSASDDG